MTYPVDPKFQTINVRSNNFTSKSESLSGKISVRANPTQRWEMTASYDRLTKQEVGIVNAFVVSQGGEYGQFPLIPTEISSTRGTASGTCTITTGKAIGVSIIPISITGSLLRGDFVKFSNHAKIYMVTEDRSGAGNLTIYPPLVSAVTTSHTVIYDGVTFTVRLNNSVQSYEVSANNQYNVEVDFVEAI